MNDTNSRLRPDEPCAHSGCLSHVTHPCEGCGRIAGQYPMTDTLEQRIREALEPICTHSIVPPCFNCQGEGRWARKNRIARALEAALEPLNKPIPSSYNAYDAFIAVLGKCQQAADEVCR